MRCSAARSRSPVRVTWRTGQGRPQPRRDFCQVAPPQITEFHRFHLWHLAHRQWPRSHEAHFRRTLIS